MATAVQETGIFTDVASLTIALGFFEYDLNVPFWSDGAEKRRRRLPDRGPSIDPIEASDTHVIFSR